MSNPKSYPKVALTNPSKKATQPTSQQRTASEPAQAKTVLDWRKKAGKSTHNKYTPLTIDHNIGFENPFYQPKPQPMREPPKDADTVRIGHREHSEATYSHPLHSTPWRKSRKRVKSLPLPPKPRMLRKAPPSTMPSDSSAIPSASASEFKIDPATIPSTEFKLVDKRDDPMPAAYQGQKAYFSRFPDYDVRNLTEDQKASPTYLLQLLQYTDNERMTHKNEVKNLHWKLDKSNDYSVVLEAVLERRKETEIKLRQIAIAERTKIGHFASDLQDVKADYAALSNTVDKMKRARSNDIDISHGLSDTMRAYEEAAKKEGIDIHQLLADNAELYASSEVVQCAIESKKEREAAYETIKRIGEEFVIESADAHFARTDARIDAKSEEMFHAPLIDFVENSLVDEAYAMGLEAGRAYARRARAHEAEYYRAWEECDRLWAAKHKEVVHDLQDLLITKEREKLVQFQTAYNIQERRKLNVPDFPGTDVIERETGFAYGQKMHPHKEYRYDTHMAFIGHPVERFKEYSDETMKGYYGHVKEGFLSVKPPIQKPNVESPEILPKRERDQNVVRNGWRGTYGSDARPALSSEADT